MTHSIRLRIALFVLAAVGFVQIVFSLYVLGRLESVQRLDVDLLLAEQLAEVDVLLGTPQLNALIDLQGHSSKWNEMFFEIRDADGRIVGLSSNVPATGLPISPDAIERGGVRISDALHPASRKGHRFIRIAETTSSGYTIRVARSLRRQEKAYSSLRKQLLWGFLAVSTLGGLCAWWVAARSLAPLRAMTARARALRTSLEGELPRSGRGDELDHLAEVVNDLLGRIRSEVGRMRRMTADAAHALRTPLTAIRGNLELQARNADASTAEELGQSLEAIDELGRLVDALLMLERIESGPRTSGAWSPLRFDLLVGELVDALQAVAADRGVNLKSEAAPALVRGDREQLRNAVANLLDNALRHTPAGGDIRARVHVANEHVVLSVSDTGPGLGPDQIDEVFERFYSSAENGGTGLGLPIARAIAEAHGGTLTAVSGVESGARFDLVLPRTSGRSLLS